MKEIYNIPAICFVYQPVSAIIFNKKKEAHIEMQAVYDCLNEKKVQPPDPATKSRVPG